MATGGLLEQHNPLDVLEHAVAELATQFLPSLDRKDLGERSLRLLAARERLNAVVATTIAEAERAGVPALGKQRTMAQYLASRSHCAPEIVRADARVGLWVSQFSQLEDAMLQGTLSRRHVDLLRGTDNIRVFAAMQRDQHLFIEWVNKLEWNGYKKAVTYWLLVNDQDGERPEDHNAKNTCTVRETADGRYILTINLDPKSGAIAKRQLEIENGHIFDKDNEDDVVRTPAQRRAEAFNNLIERGANRSETSSKPLIHVVMSLKVLQHALAQLAKQPEEQDFTSVLDANDVDGKCELADGTPLHPKYALILLMQARIRRQVLTAKSKTLNASERTRGFPDWMKDIRIVEAGGQCETAGCDATFEWLQADHHKPFSETQQTTLDDLRCLCAADNKAKSNGPPLAERRTPTPEAQKSRHFFE